MRRNTVSNEQPTSTSPSSGGQTPTNHRYRRAVSWGQHFSSGDGGDFEGKGGLGGSREGRQDGERWDNDQDSATSGLGFMAALQRTLVRGHQLREEGQEEDGDREERVRGVDHHALELLSTIAACCEVW